MAAKTIQKWLLCTNVNILRLSVAYLYVSTNSETWNAILELGSNGSSQTLQTLWVDRYVSGFGSPGGSGLDRWTGLEQNWTIFVVQTRAAGRLPGPVGNTTHFEVHLFIFVCLVLIMFSLALTQWPLCTQIVIDHNAAHCSVSGSSRSASASILIYTLLVCVSPWTSIMWQEKLQLC